MYASRVVSFYIFKENSFCTWHFISFWSSYPYLTPVLLSPFFFVILIYKTAIQNDLLMSIITVTMSGNWSVFILYFLLSFCVLFIFIVVVIDGHSTSWKKKKTFPPHKLPVSCGQISGTPPLPPKTRKLALFVCCLLFVVVERSDEFQVRSVIVVLLESL